MSEFCRIEVFYHSIEISFPCALFITDKVCHLYTNPGQLNPSDPEHYFEEY